jgi:sugar phosphate permease
MGIETATRAMTIEARTIQKIRLRILPFILILYVVAFLDRVNIGFAALTMNKELAISSQQYGLLSGIFFIGYFLFEVPSNLLLHKIGARIWIARILITWGAVAAFTGFVHSVHQLYAARFLLGLAEAGYAPGIFLYLTYWFPQREFARAIALFLTGIPVASVLGAPVSGLILDHVHWLAISSWRWLLILEGLPAIVCGVLTYFLLPTRPAEAKFLAQDEKNWITAELAREKQEKTNELSTSALHALSHRRVWHLSLHLLYFSDRDLRDRLLDASSSEISFEPFLQHRCRLPGDGSLPGHLSGDDPGFPQFRPQVGTAIPRGNSSLRCGHFLDPVGCYGLSLALDHAMVLRSNGTKL